MRVLAELKVPTTARQVRSWLAQEPEAAEQTLIAMGPPVEEDVLWILDQVADPKLRISAARILEQIGTRKCLGKLQIASRDARDPRAADAARIAWEVVNARVSAPPRR